MCDQGLAHRGEKDEAGEDVRMSLKYVTRKLEDQTLEEEQAAAVTHQVRRGRSQEQEK